MPRVRIVRRAVPALALILTVLTLTVLPAGARTLIVIPTEAHEFVRQYSPEIVPFHRGLVDSLTRILPSRAREYANDSTVTVLVTSNSRALKQAIAQQHPDRLYFPHFLLVVDPVDQGKGPQVSAGCFLSMIDLAAGDTLTSKGASDPPPPDEPDAWLEITPKNHPELEASCLHRLVDSFDAAMILMNPR